MKLRSNWIEQILSSVLCKLLKNIENWFVVLDWSIHNIINIIGPFYELLN